MKKINKKKFTLKEVRSLSAEEWAKEKLEDTDKEKFKEKAEEYGVTNEKAQKLKDLFSGSGKEDKDTPSSEPKKEEPSAGAGSDTLEDVTGKFRSFMEPSKNKKFAFSGGSAGFEQVPDSGEGGIPATGGQEASTARKKYYMSGAGAGSPGRAYEDPDSPASEAKEKGSSSSSSGGCSLTPKYSKQCPDNNLSSRCGGENVKLAQQKLMSKGISLPKYKDDCKYGNETTVGVKKFQKNNGLPPTGIIDQATHDKLFAANENKILNQFKMMENRYSDIEKLVFERLVKGCK